MILIDSSSIIIFINFLKYSCFWRKAWQTTPVFLPAKLRGEKAWQATVHRGHKESDTTEHTRIHTHTQLVYNIVLVSAVQQSEIDI